TDGVAQEAVARAGEELRVADRDVGPADAAIAVALLALAVVDAIAAVHSAARLSFVQYHARLALPGTHEGDQRVDIRRLQRAAALDGPGGHDGALSSVGDRLLQERI